MDNAEETRRHLARGILRNRVAALSKENKRLRDGIKVWCQTCEHNGTACGLCPLHDAMNPGKPKQASLIAENGG